MFKSKIIFFFFLINISLFSQDFPLNYERLSVDFNGVTYNGKSIICYGTGGIVLRSTDFGESWEQKQLAHDVYTVMKIVHLDNSYYGILDSNYFVYSENDGLNWSKIKIDDGLDFIDICSDSDGIYLLTENEILLIDFNFNIIKRVSLSNPDKSQRFVNTNESLLLCDSKNILSIFNKKDLSFSQTVDLKEYLSDGDSSAYLKFIKSANNLYLKTGKEIIKSSDNGISWTKILSDTSIFTVNQEKIFLLSSAINKSKNISTLKFQAYENYSLRIIYDDTAKSYVSRQFYTEFEFLNKDTIIAVGKDKLINISYDGGSRWELNSNLRIAGITSSKWLNENIGFFCTDKYQIFRTSNSGTTWLPQKYNYKNRGELTFAGPEAWYLDEDGTQLIYSAVSVKKKDNILFSKDFGKSFEAKFDGVAYGYIPDNMFLPLILKKDSTYLLVECIKDIGPHRLTLLVEYDKNINPINKWLIDSVSIIFATKSENENKFIGIGIEQEHQYGDSMQLLSSVDGGKTWNEDYKFSINRSFINTIGLVDDMIFFSTYDDDTANPKKYITRVDFLDYKKKQLYPFIMKDTFFIYDICPLENSLIATSYQGKIFSNPDYKADFYTWISHEIAPLYDINIDFSNNKVAYGPGGYVVFGPFGFNQLLNNYYKITKKKTESVEETETEIPPVYFFTMKPYPLPADDKVSCHIFTTMDFNPSEPDVFVYDLFGKKVSLPGDISMCRFSNWEWDLVWDCSRNAEGIYFIVLKEGNISRPIRVVVSR